MKRRILKSWLQVAVALSLIAFATLARADAPGPLESVYQEGALFGSGHAGTEGMTGGAAGVQGQFHVRP